MFNDPKTILIAFLGGMLPSLVWLWFWLKQEEKRPEPSRLLLGTFIMGMLAVIIVVPVQKFIHSIILSSNWELIAWAAVEEMVKYAAALAIVYKSKDLDQPLDWVIYLMTAGLGFAALENTLFLITPISLGKDVVTLMTGGLRFLGSTLLHAIASGFIGVTLGLSFYMKKSWRNFYLLFGFVFATALHSIFNFFIIKNEGTDFLKVFAFLWVISVVAMLLFEKVRRMSGEY